MAEKALRALDVESATGPDLLPARILKECASVVCVPLAMLLTRTIASGEWPLVWTRHWVIPLYKKKSIFDGRNYRGIHLTAQLSKVAERMLQQLYVPFLCETVAFGPRQFAYAAGVEHEMP